MSSNIASLKGNGLNAIFAKAEAEMELHRALRLLWDTSVETEVLDDVLSAVYRQDKRVDSIDISELIHTEFKVNIVSNARTIWMGLDRIQKYVDEQDIIGQVYVVKGEGEREAAIISQTAPWGMIRRAGATLGMDFTVGIIARLARYSKGLYEYGYRITSFTSNRSTFTLVMHYEDVAVKMVIYLDDLVRARYYMAYNHETFSNL